METRKINLNAILGMDCRDVNTDQQRVKEIVNMVKDREGWRIRDSLQTVTTGISDNSIIHSAFMRDIDKVLLHIDRSIYIYELNSDDTFGDLIEKYDFTYEFDLYATPDNYEYIMVDKTNHKSYKLAFVDRVMTIINDTGTLDTSTELLMNEFEPDTGDFTWGGMARRDANYTAGSPATAWTRGVDTYCMKYDVQYKGTEKEWGEIAILNQVDHLNGQTRYVVVAGSTSSAGAHETRVYLFPWGQKYPHKYERKVTLANSNVFRIDGTGASNSDARFMDILGQAYLSGDPASATVMDYRPIISISDVDGVMYAATGGDGGWIYSYSPITKKWTPLGTTDWSSIWPVSCICNFGTTLVAGTEIGELFYWDGSAWNAMTYTTATPQGAITCMKYSKTFKKLYVGLRLVSSDTTNLRTTYRSTTTSPATSDFEAIRFKVAADTQYDMAVSLEEFYGQMYVGVFYKSTVYYCDIFKDTDGVSTDWADATEIGDLADNISAKATIGDAYNNSVLPYMILHDNCLYFNGVDESSTAANVIPRLYKVQYNQTTGARTSSDAEGEYYSDITTTISGGFGKLFSYNGDLYCIPSWGALGLWITAADDQYVYKITGKTLEGVDLSMEKYHFTLHPYLFENPGTTIAASNISTERFVIFIPNDDVIMALSYDGTTAALTTGFIAPSGMTASMMVKVMDMPFGPDQSGERLVYLLTAHNTTTSDGNIGVVFLYETNGSSKETGTAATDAFLYESIATPSVDKYNYKDLLFLHLTRNRKYDYDFTAPDIKMGYTAIIGYSDERGMEIDTIDMWCGSDSMADAGHVTRYVSANSISPSREGNLGNTYRFVSTGPLYSFVDTSGGVLYVYVCVGARLYRYKLTGGRLTSGDPSAVEYFLTGEVSRYCDPEGGFFGAVSSNVRGYDLIEINSSKPLPLRPYFTYDADETSLHEAYAIVDQGDEVNDDLSGWILNGVTLTNTDNGRLYWEITGSTGAWVISLYKDVGKASLVASSEPATGGATFNLLERNSSGLTGTVDVVASPVVNTGTNNVLILGIDSAELFNIFQMEGPFRTPVKVGGGSTLDYMDDSRTKRFKYWMFYLLYSGASDPGIPFVNIARGIYNPLTDSYALDYWRNDVDFSELTETGSEGLPREFSNQKENNQPAITPGTEVYVAYDKIFHKYGDQYRDRFSCTVFWEQSKSVLFELQHCSFYNGNIMLALNYDKKQFFYTQGRAFINLLNFIKTTTRPVATAEIGKASGVLACENGIYHISGTDESNISLQLLASEIGLEKENKQALVAGNGKAFMYNRKGIYMIDQSGIGDISGPVQDFLFRRGQLNRLGINPGSGELYIPLDYDSLYQDLKVVLKQGDYSLGAPSTGTEWSYEWDKVFAVFNPADLSFRMYAYQDSSTVDVVDCLFTLKDHIAVRVGGTIVIPEYQESQGTEQPLARITFKRSTFGSLTTLKKIDTIKLNFINQQNVNLLEYGIDYLKMSLLINNKPPRWEKKYGDLNSSTYTDCTPQKLVIDVAADGLTRWKLPAGDYMDFRDITISAEFTRLSDIASATTAKSVTALVEVDIDVEQKDSEILGVR